MKQSGFGFSIVMFFAILAFGLASDLYSKHWVFEKYWPYYQANPHAAAAEQPIWVVGEFLGIQTSTNGGASFGMLQGYQFYFSILGFVALLAILGWVVIGGWRDRGLTFCLGAISGGILGNMYDRLGFWHIDKTPKEHFHHVRDFIHFRIEGIGIFDPWPNFNIADSLLVCGVTFLFVKTIFFSKENESSPETESEADSE